MSWVHTLFGLAGKHKRDIAATGAGQAGNLIIEGASAMTHPVTAAGMVMRPTPAGEGSTYYETGYEQEPYNYGYEDDMSSATNSMYNLNQGGEAMVPMKPEEYLLRQREGYSDKVYLDSVGVPTVGVGHAVPGAEVGSTPYTPEQNQANFHANIELAKQRAIANVGPEKWAKLNREQQMALISQAFQLGGAGQAKFKNMLDGVREGDNAKVRKEAMNSLWAQQTPKRANDMVKAFRNEGGGIPDLNDPTNVDTVPAMLTAGEYVLNKEATAMFKPQIEAMNEAGLQQRKMENEMIKRNNGGNILFANNGAWVDDEFEGIISKPINPNQTVVRTTGADGRMSTIAIDKGNQGIDTAEGPGWFEDKNAHNNIPAGFGYHAMEAGVPVSNVPTGQGNEPPVPYYPTTQPKSFTPIEGAGGRGVPSMTDEYLTQAQYNRVKATESKVVPMDKWNTLSPAAQEELLKQGFVPDDSTITAGDVETMDESVPTEEQREKVKVIEETHNRKEDLENTKKDIEDIGGDTSKIDSQLDDVNKEIEKIAEDVPGEVPMLDDIPPDEKVDEQADDGGNDNTTNPETDQTAGPDDNQEGQNPDGTVTIGGTVYNPGDTVTVGDLTYTVGPDGNLIPNTQEAAEVEKNIMDKAGEFFGLDGMALKQFALFYFGSRLAGGSHAGSMQWAGKAALQMAGNRQKQAQELEKARIEAGQKAARKKKSGVKQMEVNGRPVTFFEYEDGTGTHWVATIDGRELSYQQLVGAGYDVVDKGTKDKDTRTNAQQWNTNSSAWGDSAGTIMDQSLPAESRPDGVAYLTGSEISSQSREYFKARGYDINDPDQLAAMQTIVDRATRRMVNHIKQNPDDEPPGSIEPFLKMETLHSITGAGSEVWLTNPDAEWKDRTFVDPAKVSGLDDKLGSIVESDFEGNPNRYQIDQQKAANWKLMESAWNSMTPEQQAAYGKPGKGENGFLLFVDKILKDGKISAEEKAMLQKATSG